MPSYGDIWNKILEENYLHLLTDMAPNKETLLKIDEVTSNFGSSMDAVAAKNMQNVFAKTANNATMTESFKMYLNEHHKVFEQQLKVQAEETKRELEEERRLEQEKQQAEEQLRKEERAREDQLE